MVGDFRIHDTPGVLSRTFEYRGCPMTRRSISCG